MTKEDNPMECGDLHVAGDRNEKPKADLLARQRAAKLAYREPDIRSGQCSSCDHYTSLWYDSGMCVECYDQHEALHQPVIMVAKPDDHVEYSEATPPPTRYWQGFAHGAVLTLVAVVVLTGLLLLWGLP